MVTEWCFMLVAVI